MHYYKIEAWETISNKTFLLFATDKDSATTLYEAQVLYKLLKQRFNECDIKVLTQSNEQWVDVTELMQ